MRWFIALSLLTACATMQNDRTVCPEYRKLRCATQVDCSWDAARSCRVCRCAPAHDGVTVPPASEPPLSH